MSVRRNRPSSRPLLTFLEPRDVPATFYVDPLLAGAIDGSTQTFNAGKANQVTGLTFGTTEATAGATLFSSFSAALAKANGAAGADTILLADGTIAIDNSAGSVSISDDLTITGGSGTRSILTPTNDTPANDTVLYVPTGKALNLNTLRFDGGSKVVFNGITYDGANGALNTVEVTNVRAGNQSSAVTAVNSSTVNVLNSVIYNYGRIGVTYYDSQGTVKNSNIVGDGVVVGNVVQYGVQVAGASSVQFIGNRIFNNQSLDAGSGTKSASIFMYQDGGSPTAFINSNAITNNAIGIIVGGGAPDGSTAVIRSNDLNSNTVGIEVDTGSVTPGSFGIDAQANWWGSTLGPAAPQANSGTGSSVTAGVDYFRWLPQSILNSTPYPTTGIAYAPPGTGKAYLLVGGTEVVVTPFAGYTGDIRVASGDVTGDGFDDLVVGSGPGSLPLVRVYNGKTAAFVREIQAYGTGFNGGVNVALADVTGDGVKDIITGAGPGGGPHVKTFNGLSGAAGWSFFAFDEAFGSGVTVSGGDANNDGFADLFVGTGPGGGTTVRVFNGKNLAILQQFQAFPGFGGQVNVAAGDVNGDGRADVITAPGAGGGTNVRTYFTDFAGTFKNVQYTFQSGDANFGGGVRLAAHDVDGDLQSDIVIGFGPGATPKFRIVNGVPVSKSQFPTFNDSWTIAAGSGGLYVG